MSGKLAQQKVVCIFRLLDQQRNNLLECVDQTGIGVWQVALNVLMKVRQCVKRNHRKHMVFNVVIHVEVEKTKNPIQPYRARIEAVIAHVLG